MRRFGGQSRRRPAILVGSALLLSISASIRADDVKKEVAPATPATAAAEIKPTPTDGTSLLSESILSESMVESGGACDTCGTSDTCDTCCKPCCTCPPGRFWARGELLLWWTDGQHTPPLVTTSPVGTPVGQAGVLGATGTSVLNGNTNIGETMLPGGRFNLGYWLDDCQRIGLQGGFFFLANNGNNSVYGSDGSQIISRPFFDANPSVNAQNSELVSYPGILGGSVGVSSSTQFLGANALMRLNLCCHSCPTCDVCDDPCGPGGKLAACFRVPKLNCCRFDLLSGFQYVHLNDNLAVNENLTVLNNVSPYVPGTNILVNDTFKTRNDFYGYDIGGVLSCYKGRWFFDCAGQIAFGVNDQSATVSGATTTSVPGGTTSTTSGGLLAQGTNIGTYNDSTFAVMPQMQLNVGYQVTRHLRLFTGYTFLYISSVARAGDQIDTTVNSSQIGGDPLVGPARPAFAFHNTDFWAQGINFGADVRF